MGPGPHPDLSGVSLNLLRNMFRRERTGEGSEITIAMSEVMRAWVLAAWSCRDPRTDARRVLATRGS